VHAILIVATAAACAVTLDVGWVAAATAVALVVLVEVSVRRAPDGLTAGLWLAVAAMAVLVTTVEPWAALTVAGVGTAWSAARLVGAPPLTAPIPVLGRWPAGIGACVLPLVGLAAARVLWSPDAALVGFAVLVVAAAAALRARPALRATGPAVWVVGQSAVLAALVADEHRPATGSTGAGVAALLLVAAALALLPRWPCARVWMVAAAAGSAGALAAEGLGWSLATGAVVAGAVALVLVGLGQVPTLAVRGHTAVMAHVVGAGAVLAALARPGGEPAWWALAATVVAGALGWALSSVIGEGLGSAEVDLWDRLGRGGAVRDEVVGSTSVGRGHLGAVVPAVAALVGWLAVPPLVLVATGWLPWGDPWLPVSSLAVAVVAVGLGRAIVGGHRLVGRTLGTAIWTGLVLVPAALGWWPAATAALLVVGMAVLCGPELGNILTTTFGWVASGVAAVTAAGALGVAPASLHRVAFGWGSAALLGSLVTDDVRAGRRTAGEVIRRTELWPPFLLGASTAVLALAPVAGESAAPAGWTLLVASAVGFATAILLRLGVVSLVGWVLLASASLLLSPWSVTTRPWLLVVLAALLLAAAEAMHDLVPVDDRDRLERRWDLPPFVVGQAFAVLALTASAALGWVPATWLAVAALWAVTGIRLRSPWWFAAAVPTALVGATAIGPAWLCLGLALTAVSAVVAATRTVDGTRLAFQVVGATALAGTWATLGWWRAWDAETVVVATAAAAGIGLLLLAVGVRWLRLGLDWLAAFVAVPVLYEASAVLLMASPDVPRSPAWSVVAAALASTSAAVALLARPTGQDWLRWTAAVILPGAALLLAGAVELGTTPFVASALLASLVAVVLGSVLVEAGARSWPGPILLTGAILLTAGATVAFGQWPDRTLLVLAFGTTGVELLGIGLATRRVGWLAVAPWAFLAAWVTYASEALTGDPQWITLPLGLTTIAMVEIVRWSRRRVGADDRPTGGTTTAAPVLALTDLAGMAFVVGPAIVETVTRSPVYGLVAAALGAGLLALAVLTRVRRRLIVGATTVLAALVLMIVPPLVDLVPPLTGWVPWALLALLGLAALMGAAFLEKGRMLVRRGLRTFAELTRDWD
jgi:hypothetical protein